MRDVVANSTISESSLEFVEDLLLIVFDESLRAGSIGWKYFKMEFWFFSIVAFFFNLELFFDFLKRVFVDFVVVIGVAVVVIWCCWRIL